MTNIPDTGVHVKHNMKLIELGYCSLSTTPAEGLSVMIWTWHPSSDTPGSAHSTTITSSDITVGSIVG